MDDADLKSSSSIESAVSLPDPSNIPTKVLTRRRSYSEDVVFRDAPLPEHAPRNERDKLPQAPFSGSSADEYCSERKHQTASNLSPKFTSKPMAERKKHKDIPAPRPQAATHTFVYIYSVAATFLLLYLYFGVPSTNETSSRASLSYTKIILLFVSFAAAYYFRNYREYHTKFGLQKIQSMRRHLKRQLTSPTALTMEGVQSSGKFLTGVVTQLWDNINVSLSAMIKEMMEPMFKDMLPGPMRSLHFTTLDLGRVPIKLEDIFIHPVRDGCVQIDVDVVWDGECDIELRANVMRGLVFGVQSIKLSGRMSLLLSPLMNELPVISAIQYAFTNPPDLELDFTGWAQIAKFSMVAGTIRKIIYDCLNSMVVLPNRMLYKMDLANDFLDTYQPPLGILRVTAVKGRGFEVLKKLMISDIPDIYCKIRVGASKIWKTSTQEDNLSPEWNESADFLLSDFDQIINFDVYDEDLVDVDYELGRGQVTVRDLIRLGGSSEFELIRNGVYTASFITLRCEIFELTPEVTSFDSLKHQGKNLLCGLLIILVTRAFNVPLKKEDAATFVQVRYGKKKFFTGVVTDYPGIDALNPTFDCAFHIPLTTQMVENTHSAKDVVFALMNGENCLGTTSVAHSFLLGSLNRTVTARRQVGGKGCSLEFCISLCGLRPEKLHKSPGEDRESSFALRPTAEIRKRAIRVTALRGRGFKIEKKTFGKDDIPDVYCVIKVVSSPRVWRTSTIKDDTMPQWNESSNFLIWDPNEILRIDAFDENRRSKDDYIGRIEIELSKLLRAGKPMEAELKLKDKGTGAYITVRCVELESFDVEEEEHAEAFARSSSQAHYDLRKSIISKKKLKRKISTIGRKFSVKIG